MQLATGSVVEGKVVIEGLGLPEGAVITVPARDEEESVRLSQADEADREWISAEELFARLKRFGRPWCSISRSNPLLYDRGRPAHFGTTHAAVQES